jgi:hypothetical protein
MRRIITIALMLPLVGCDKPGPAPAPPAQQQASAKSENDGLGRWAIATAVPAGKKEDMLEYSQVWRLDTKTGDLQLCTYSIMGLANHAPVEGIDCSASIKGGARRN